MTKRSFLKSLLAPLALVPVVASSKGSEEIHTPSPLDAQDEFEIEARDADGNLLCKETFWAHECIYLCTTTPKGSLTVKRQKH